MHVRVVSTGWEDQLPRIRADDESRDGLEEHVAAVLESSLQHPKPQDVQGCVPQAWHQRWCRSASTWCDSGERRMRSGWLSWLVIDALLLPAANPSKNVQLSSMFVYRSPHFGMQTYQGWSIDPVSGANVKELPRLHPFTFLKKNILWAHAGGTTPPANLAWRH